MLGIGREALILATLGPSAANDKLQTALTVTYLISMLGDAGRNAVLSSLKQLSLRQVGQAVALRLVIVSIVIIALSLWAFPDSAVPTVMLASLAGILNVAVAMTLCAWQMHERTLEAQGISAMANLTLFVAAVIATLTYQLTPTVIIATVVLAPVSQILAIILLARADRTPFSCLNKRGLKQETNVDPAKTFLESCIGVAGGQIGQLAVRTAMIGMGTGALSLFSVMMRLFDSIRSIMLEPYAATRIKTWAKAQTVLLPIHLSPRMLFRFAGAAVAISLLVPLWRISNPLVATMIPGTIIVGIGTLLVFAYRVLLTAASVTTHQTVPFLAISMVDVVICSTLFLSQPMAPTSAILVTFYIARPVVLVYTLSRSSAFNSIAFPRT